MDTKWKSWKVPVSFLAFVLGVCLLLGGGAISAAWTARLVAHSGGSPLDPFRGDYQDTERFRRYLSGELRDLLERGAEGNATLLKAHFGREYNLQAAVVRDGRLLYANGGLKEQEQMRTDPRTLPDGFNFLLVYEDGGVTVTKDGEELDIYGDGYYRDGDWDVPGYENYQADPAWAGLEVYLQCRAEPLLQIDSSGYNNDGLYRLSWQLLQDRVITLAAYGSAAAGLALFFWYVCWRRYKKAADQTLARGTGHIWLEFKLAALLVLPLLLVGSAGVALNILNYGVGYAANPWVTWLLIPLGPCLLYLVVNDLRHNRARVFHNSFCGTLFRLFRKNGMERPFQKRVLRRIRWQAAMTAPFVLGAAVAGEVWGLNAVRYGPNAEVLIIVMLCTLALALLAGLYQSFRRQRADARELGALIDQISALRAGNFTAPLVLPESSDLYGAAAELDGIQRGMEAAVAERMKSERMKVELVANVSHDLKTPLTSILSYADLLGREEGLPEHVQDYIRILNDKALRLKTMVQEVFEISKAASGDLPVSLERLDLAKLLRQTLADMDEAVSASGLTFKTDLPEAPVMISADGDKLYRVFQNLLQNALQYALEGSRVYISLRAEGGAARAEVKNTSREELPAGVDFTERFVRGDESRTDGGSGLGLAIASSFTRACGGQFRVVSDADLFTARVEFPLAETAE